MGLQMWGFTRSLKNDSEKDMLDFLKFIQTYNKILMNF